MSQPDTKPHGQRNAGLKIIDTSMSLEAGLESQHQKNGRQAAQKQFVHQQHELVWARPESSQQVKCRDEHHDESDQLQ